MHGYTSVQKLEAFDLTHTLTPDIPHWHRVCGFQSELIADYDQGYRGHTLQMFAGIGTHIDAPAHFFEDACDIASISLNKLIAPVCLINVSEKAHADYFISYIDIIEFEKAYGRIPEQSVVIAYTGWSKRWQNAASYRNEDENGNMHFPGFSEESVRLLLERNIAGIGIDTLSPDGSNNHFPVHKLLLKKDCYIIENIANAQLLRPIGDYIAALPLKIKDGTEAPSRIIGLRIKS